MLFYKPAFTFSLLALESFFGSKTTRASWRNDWYAFWEYQMTGQLSQKLLIRINSWNRRIEWWKTSKYAPWESLWLDKAYADLSTRCKAPREILDYSHLFDAKTWDVTVLIISCWLCSSKSADSQVPVHRHSNLWGFIKCTKCSPDCLEMCHKN